MLKVLSDGTKARVSVPAKLNLFFEVAGTRPDGYHDIRSVMQSVSLNDDVTVTLTGGEGITLSCGGADIPADQRNTAYKAAERFFACTGKSRSVHIDIEKRIPLMGGMGGSSADAAGVLAALNVLTGTLLSPDELCAISVSVGADVPFMLMGGTLLCEGLGERMSPLPLLPICRIVIARPNEGSHTAGVYRRYDELKVKPTCDITAILDGLRAGSLAAVGAGLCNALEAAAATANTQRIKDIMTEFSPAGVLMTGSGSCVFGLFLPDADTSPVERKLLAQGYAVYSACPAEGGI